MATSTYTPIASITLGSSASSVEFSSIPQDYRDLVLVANCLNSVNTAFTGSLNGNTTDANYSYVDMQGTGSVFSNSFSGRQIGSAHTVMPSTIIQFLDYSATDKHKTYLFRDNNSNDPSVKAGAIRFASTSAVTSIELAPASGNFVSGAKFALYGIEA